MVHPLLISKWLYHDLKRSSKRLLSTGAARKLSSGFIYRNIAKYKRGATILLRDSLPLDVPIEDQVEIGPSEDEKHVCITDHHAVVRERVADKMFTFSANSFFQNNNGILRSLVEAIRDMLPSDEEERYLVDTYCGSGLFAITLAEKFKEVAGVEISCECLYVVTNHDHD